MQASHTSGSGKTVKTEQFGGPNGTITTQFAYDAAGEKLSVTHQTAKAGVVIPITNVMTPLAPVNALATTKTDYCGNVIYEDGELFVVSERAALLKISSVFPIFSRKSCKFEI